MSESLKELERRLAVELLAEMKAGLAELASRVAMNSRKRKSPQASMPQADAVLTKKRSRVVGSSDDVRTRLEKAVEAAEYESNMALKKLDKAQRKLDIHRLLEKVKRRIAEIREGACCICLKGYADHDDCPYCEDCDLHVQNVPKHSLHREWFDVCPIAWDEWWVPRDLYYSLLGYGMLTPAGKLKQELEF